MENQKILLCVNSDIGRGNSIGFRFGKIAEELERRKIDFDIIARANYSKFPAQVPFYKNYLARFLKAIRIYLFPSFDDRQIDIWLFDRFVLRRLKNMKRRGIVFSLVHFGEPCPKSMFWLKKQGIKILLDMPIGHYKYSLYLQNKGFQLDSKVKLEKFIDVGIDRADLLVIPSQFVDDTLKMAGWKDKSREIIHFGTDKPTNFNEQNIEKRFLELKNHQRPMTFVFMGAVNFRKGVNFLLSAWDKANLKNARLIVGGHIYKSMRSELKKYEKKNVELLGFAHNWKELMRESDIFVFPSLLEGSSKAVFEALSYGLPVITTPNAGSVVEDGRDGFIVPIGDSSVIAKKMLYFYNNPDKIMEMGKLALEKSKSYTWENYSRKVVDLYGKFTPLEN